MSLFGGNKSSTAQNVTETDNSANTAGDNSPAASNGGIAAGMNAIGGNYVDNSVTNYSSVSTTTGVGVGTAPIASQGGFGAGYDGGGGGSAGLSLNTNTLMLIGIGVSVLGIILFATRK